MEQYGSQTVIVLDRLSEEARQVLLAKGYELVKED